MATEEEEALKALERDKARLIKVYMALQDKADGINEEIYNTCCDIETLNVRISEAEERLQRLMGGKAPVNGKALPSTGKAVPRSSKTSSE